MGAGEERRQPLPPHLAPACGRVGVRGKQAPWPLMALTLVRAKSLVLGLHFLIRG